MMARWLTVTTLWLAAMAGLLLGTAGDPRWLNGWLLIGELAAFCYPLGFWLHRHDPALLAARLSPPFHRDQKTWDRVFMALAGLSFVAWMALMALDARRFAWSSMPAWLQPAGVLLIAACLSVAWVTFRFNSFAAPQVRVQADRGQRVITDGPYRVVRHPMYAGAALLFIGAPLLLGSWWGLAVAPLLIAGTAARAVGEERVLRRELAGYDAYAQRVRYRLLPGVW
ncbi:MAG: isoprenylcysteine carboxylmethyltransferase family protein [Acetobacteraceae bacterium]|nr:isoprenylcysteine carboxylmethyltransferase family protein [Acetobacteraceae bacterium]